MVTIRKMQEKDTAAAAKMEAGLFSQPWSAQAFLDALHLENTVFLAAEENDCIVGYIGMYISLDEGEITNVAVDPAKHRCGIGKQLIKEMKKEAKRCAVTKIVLEVRVSNEPAIRLYESNGFTRCGIRRGFYEFPKEDAYIMVYAH